MIPRTGECKGGHTPCNLGHCYHCFGGTYCFRLQSTKILHPEDVCSTFLPNDDARQADYVTSHPTRQ